MGKEISGAGDSPVKIHLVEAGSVGIYRLTGDGQRVLEGIRGPGEMLGLAGAFCRASGARSTLAVSNVSLVSIFRDDFQELLSCDPFLLKKILELITFRMDAADPRTAGICLRQAYHRLTGFLR